jgi:divalent metal cation (Fe/Co/Zn/Cd) transporter
MGTGKESTLNDKVYYLDAQQKAMFATKIGAFANISLSISKGIIGLSIASTALIADAVNSFSDVVGDAVVYYAVQEARKNATPDRPWGKGKLEPLGALTVGGILLATGFGIGYSALLHVLEIAEIPAFDLFEYFQIGKPTAAGIVKEGAEQAKYVEYPLP